MIFISAVSEGEFGFHVHACKDMISYLFAGGHWNYPRDSIVNLIMDVSVLFFSNFKKINWSLTELYINVFTDDKKLISINKSVGLSHHNVTPSLIALYLLSGCKSVPMIFGTGKSKT